MNHHERGLRLMLRDMTDSELNAHNETVKKNLVALPFGSDAYNAVLAEWSAVRSEIKMRLLIPKP